MRLPCNVRVCVCVCVCVCERERERERERDSLKEKIVDRETEIARERYKKKQIGDTEECKIINVYSGVNFINVKNANFSYELRLSSYVLALSKNSYEKIVRKTLMKLTANR